MTSYFVSGKTETFPLWIYGAVKVGTPPQVFVLGTLIFVVGVLIAATNLLVQGRRASVEGRRARRPGMVDVSRFESAN